MYRRGDYQIAFIWRILVLHDCTEIFLFRNDSIRKAILSKIC